MKKTYSLKFFICIFLFFAGINYAQSQNQRLKEKANQQIINLSIYPNPVSTGKIFITTKLNLEKQIEIYDVLAKKVMALTLRGKELLVNDLKPGIYILKIREGDLTATRKLVIR